MSHQSALQSSVVSERILDCQGKSLDLSQSQVMGILNVTPDSFSDVSRHVDVDSAVRRGIAMVEEGAAIIDIGGEPTNPSLHPIVPLDVELDRVIPVIEKLSALIDVPISVDTSKPDVMRAAVAAGAGMINDVRALRVPTALETASELNVPVCLMHMRYPGGLPETIVPDDDIVNSVKTFLDARYHACLEAGISKERIVLDPGIGTGSFGKSCEQSLRLLNQLEQFHELGLPLLVGVSRKTFIGDLLGAPQDERLYGSLSAATLAVSKGAHLIRAHDIKPTVDALRIATAILRG